ncbi:MAG TPA: hypothetical protein PL182_07050 [Pseudobdellovibrionaceae bacterium]|nr:hypothetical protein [Pseudobdellovibrionaceae bacterium]
MTKSVRSLAALMVASFFLGACSHKEKQEEQVAPQETTFEAATESAVAPEPEKTTPAKKAKKKSVRKSKADKRTKK